VVSKSNKNKRSGAHRSGRPGAVKVTAHSARATATVRPARLGDWISAARPATLGLAIAPVVLGWGIAMLVLLLGQKDAWNPANLIATGLALLLAIALQIGVNFANDYSDGVRGTDAHRVGPARLTASGRAPAKRVRLVAFIFFGIAAATGTALVVWSQYWWLFAVGAAAIAAAWFYTGGKRPYGYAGLGEIAVFVFFGLVATTGTTFILTGTFPTEAILGGVAMGSFAAAVLHINNFRDRATDIAAGKRTVATRLSPFFGRILYTVLALAPFGILVAFVFTLGTTASAFFALLFAAPAVLITWTAKSAPEYVLVLKLTVWASLAYAALIAWMIVA
jgi:1,4-dihydroxy-2-naphthoate octaprenyltransferase